MQELNRPEDGVGDHCEGKNEGCIRIVSQNINSLGLVAGNMKEKNLNEFLMEKSVDVMGIQELNIQWNKVPHKDKIWDRFRG